MEKNAFIVTLLCICIYLLIEDSDTHSKYANLSNHLSRYGISFHEWDIGELILQIDSIPGYDITFAKDTQGHVFYHRIAEDTGLFMAPGICSYAKGNKYAARPAGCFNDEERARAEIRLGGNPSCILYDLVTVDRHKL